MEISKDALEAGALEWLRQRAVQIEDIPPKVLVRVLPMLMAGYACEVLQAELTKLVSESEDGSDIAT